MEHPPPGVVCRVMGVCVRGISTTEQAVTMVRASEPSQPWLTHSNLK